LDTAKRIFFGAALGLGVGIAVGLIVDFVLERFTTIPPPWWGLLVLTGVTGAMSGAIVAWRTKSGGLLERLADKLPDEYVFPALVLALFVGSLLTILKAPDSLGLSPGLPGTGNGQARPGASSSTGSHNSATVKVILAISLDGGVTCLALYFWWSNWRPRICGTRLTNREFESVALMGGSQWAVKFYTEHKVNKLAPAAIAATYQWSQQSVESMIAYQAGRMPP
jgi:hypothetical protein